MVQLQITKFIFNSFLLININITFTRKQFNSIIMKTTITLIPEQIEQLTKAEKDLLTAQKNKAIEAIEKKYNEDIKKLGDKYKNYTIEIKEEEEKKERKPRTKIDKDQLTSYFKEGKSVKEMAELINKTEQQIRLYLSKFNLKLKDRV